MEKHDDPWMYSLLYYAIEGLRRIIKDYGPELQNPDCPIEIRQYVEALKEQLEEYSILKKELESKLFTGDSW